MEMLFLFSREIFVTPRGWVKHAFSWVGECSFSSGLDVLEHSGTLFGLFVRFGSLKVGAGGFESVYFEAPVHCLVRSR